MTVTLYSWTPPTTHASRYLLRATLLNGPRTTPLPRRPEAIASQHAEPDGFGNVRPPHRDTILDDIDDWYSPQIEDDGFLERLDRSAEIVRFP